MFPLTGKVAIVTGSGQGIGRAYAQALARAGAGVIVNDVVEEAAQQTVESIRRAGGRAEAVVAPVGSTEADELVRRAVEAFGRLDILCTNAGILRDRVLWKMTDEDFDAVMLQHYTAAIERGDKITLPSQLRKSRALGTAEDVTMSRQSSPKAGMRGAFLPVTIVLA